MNTNILTKAMKKVLLSAMLAFSFVAVAVAADEAAPTPAPTEQQPTVKRRAAPTAADRAKMREKREKMIAARKAEMAAKMLEVVKKYVPDEEQAKALIAELEQTMRPQTRRRRPPAEKKPAEAK